MLKYIYIYFANEKMKIEKYRMISKNAEKYDFF